MCSWPTPPGALMLRPGTHTVTVQSTGGDGCIEIDMITLQAPPPIGSAPADRPSFALSKCVDRIDSRGAPGGQEPGGDRNGNERE